MFTISSLGAPQVYAEIAVSTAVPVNGMMKVADAARTPVHPGAQVLEPGAAMFMGGQMGLGAGRVVVEPQATGNVLDSPKRPDSAGRLQESLLFAEKVDKEAGLSAAVVGILGTGVDRRDVNPGKHDAAYKSAFSSRNGDRHLGGKDLGQLDLFSSPAAIEPGGMFASADQQQHSNEPASASEAAALAGLSRVEPAAGGGQGRLPMSKYQDREAVLDQQYQRRSVLLKTGVTVDPDTIWVGNDVSAVNAHFEPSTGSRFDSGPMFKERSRGLNKGFTTSGSAQVRPRMMNHSMP